ncbi:Tat pathway signal sequence domain protein [Aquipuribacter hungaricus]|uniref:Tat pathway signal sequence domain protein n=1 Tax=Aquipuribacter hungaricus TaxID=545624 RepID=A0ABV7WFU3_9MICO
MRTGQTPDTQAWQASRRGVLRLGAAAAVAGPLALSTPAQAAGLSSPRLLARAEDFLRRMTDAYPAADGSGPRLAQSYSDENGLFSTAFVYDNAFAVCAALTGRDVALARTLGDGLLHAQDNDPGYDDGRLRQAYNVGPYTFYDGVPSPYDFVLPDGGANVGYQFGFLGTAVGDMAWPGMALVQLAEHTGDPRYLAGALRIAGWIVSNTRSEVGLGGFSFGVTGGNQPVPNKSTEHNIDCVGFFSQLAAATGDQDWLEQAAHARAFVERVWEPVEGFFFTGSNDGVTINPDPLPLDPQTWSWLALQDEEYARALDWAGRELAATDDASQPTSQLPDGIQVSGVTFSSASLRSTAQYNGTQVHPQGVWLEGTAQLACALADRRRGGDRRAARQLLDQVAVAQREVGQGQRVGGQVLPAASGVVAASSLLDSGFGFGYFQSQHVGATAWYVMAGRDANPMVTGGLR